MIGTIHNPTSLLRWQGSQRRIGITGSIASGKSSVGQFLKEIKKIPILDADKYSRDALGPGTASTKLVLRRYGNTVKAKNKFTTINRSALSKIIFNDPNERLWIEKLIHPIVERQLKKELDKNKYIPVVVLIIPLLFEASLMELCSEIWVVNCTAEQQYKRLMERDDLNYHEAAKRIQAQWPLEKKLNLADIVINNSGELQAWRKQVDNLC